MRVSLCQFLAPRRWLPAGLLLVLSLPAVVCGQPAPAQAPAPTQVKPMAQLPVVQNLKVLPLAGKDAMNDLERHVMSPLVVEVLDQNDRPVEGADVVFRFPLDGPSATFPGDKTSQKGRTNAQGEAAANGWTANGKPGTFEVHATATYGNQMGETTFSMSNVTRIVETKQKEQPHQKWWTSRRFKIAVIAGAAAVVTAIVLSKELGGKSSSTTTATTTPTITITPGSPTVGGP